MSTTPQNDSVGTNTSNGTSNGSSDEPKVIIDPAVLAEGAQDTSGKVEKTEPMPAQPDAAAATGAGDGSTVTPPAASSSPDPATTAPADNAGKVEEDEEPKLPTNDGRMLKYGLAAAAIVGAIGLFVIAYAFVRNSAPTATTAPVPVVVQSAPAGATAPAVPGAVVPEVRTPAPRRIDATACTRGQYVIEGNELVFRNCALLELAEPAGR